MNTFDSLVCDIKRLGIKDGDTLFVRISYKAVGKTEGGPKTLIDALLNVIGEKGTLVATAFPTRIPANKKEKYKDTLYIKGMKPTTGAIPVVMSQYPNACFSSHPISPYVAIGYNAGSITEMHTPNTESYDVVKYMIEECHSKCLRIGGDVLDGTAHIAFTEGLRKTDSYQYRRAEGNYYLDEDGKKQWIEKSVSSFCYAGFKKFFYNKIYNYPNAVLGEGQIGDGVAMLTDMGKTLEVERQYIANDPKILLCDSAECMMCRTSYSYSDPGAIRFALRQTKGLLNIKKFRNSAGRIKFVLDNRFCGNKCQ